MPTPEYMVDADPRAALGGHTMWGIWRKQGRSHKEIAVCWHEEDARMIVNALGSPQEGSRAERTVRKAIAKSERGDG